jgi:hypothetical protein
MCCLVLLASFIGPRIVLAGWWLFGDSVDAAFDTWIWPLLGLLLLPWTTLLYVIVFAWSGDVNGPQWLVVAVGVALDVAMYGARSAKARLER